jgi:nicotinate phosphoribosyltransferase
MECFPDALLTDLYQLTMVQAYLECGQTDTAVFEFFVRKLPPQRRFLMAAGLEQALDFLQNLRFSREEIDWLRTTGWFNARLIDYLANFRFRGEVHAMPEGTLFFQNEPILRVVAPLPEAQLVETRLINILHYQTLIASKAARLVLLAPRKLLVDFGLRRAHGADAGLMAARASYIAGFAGTATVLARKAFGIPVFGTLAHSFIQSFDDEITAFEAFARARPENLVLLIDTYDTESAARKVVALAPRLAQLGIDLQAVRIDSGDLAALSRTVRAILDAGGLTKTAIFASGGIDEDLLATFERENAPIDGIGIGTGLVTSSDAPALDCAYKLQEYAGLPRRKRSTGKETWPGRKQVWRRYEQDGRMMSDILSIEDDPQEGEPLIRRVMKGGERIDRQPTLDDIRAHAHRELARLPAGAVDALSVELSPSLEQLAAEVDRRTGQLKAGQLEVPT